MSLNVAMALANALLCTASLVCAVAAVRAIRQKRVSRHRNLMLGAVSTSAIFMASFVLRFVWFGFTPFEGTGALRAIYLAVFFAHEPIAVVSVPLVLVAMGLGLAGSLRAHKDIAQVAYPIWLVSLVTGVVLFFLLYGAQ